MTRFRGCIDIHSGQVKQIVGGTLSQDDSVLDTSLSTNFISSLPSSYYSKLYKDHHVLGTHVIKLGSNDMNDRVALEALREWPGYLQIGGGINDGNAKYWIDNGASHVIVTSWLFPGDVFDQGRLERLVQLIGKERLVIDLSCRTKVVNGVKQWFVATNKWQTITDLQLSKETFTWLSNYCDEFLVHAADVEGLCQGIDEELVVKLGEWCSIPITYAGGAKHLNDLQRVKELSNGKVDLTYGSALDIFGGELVKFEDVCAWNDSL